MVLRDLAVLITCHNRRERTLACLQSLYRQRDAGVALSVFLVDDGSTDGTSEAITTAFPEVRLIQGSGDLYWSGGMRRAFEAAIRDEFDFHLWLNDDVVLCRDAVRRLLSTYDDIRTRYSGPIIVAGAVRDPVTGVTTYSGLRRGPFWHPLRFELVRPDIVPRLCHTMHGNVALVSRDAFRKLGPVDQAFIHAIGDVDYGLRLGRIDGQVWLAGDHVGTCSREDATTEGPFSGSSMASRLRYVASIKMLPPRPWLTYVRRHGGPLWAILWVRPYAKAMICPRGRWPNTPRLRR